MNGTIYSINVSTHKGTIKQPVASALLLPGYGIQGDAHAGDALRQVSLLSWESIKRQNTCIKIDTHNKPLVPGDFAENITTRGILLSILSLGDVLKIGQSVLVRVSKIGKECHAYCEIYKRLGDCIMPKEGIFAEVVEGGLIYTGDFIEIVKNKSPFIKK